MNTILATITLEPVVTELSEASLALIGTALVTIAAALPVAGLFFGAAALYDWFRKLTGHEEEDDIAAMKRDHESMERDGL